MNYITQPIISGNTEGTPITHLRRDLIDSGDNDNNSHYSAESIKTTTDMRELVDEINKNIKKKKDNKKKDNGTDTRTDTDTSTDTDTGNIDRDDKKIKKNKNSNSKQNILNDSIYDGILLLIIYLLMSQDFVKTFIGKYVKIINVNEDGIVPLTGILTYGIIFVLVFLSIRLTIHKISD